ncbi:D-amino-acid transaminase [Liquorilactobacillus capillatus]|uniref:D-alanine aminotransferase n=1 Tax=Liquorilactobacillus capillatus DSM 19910 TaxID=1423731 RepID=A0A0R1LZN2_9LACO|nr:D-amino-acid transaminase [Liquorilactobacillus capillatus]KRL01119.1 D-amino acid aminotransferase [Liquorilactobacillus capillatus DSM 19910]
MHVLWNNQIVKRSDVKIDIEDRAYQFGDGLYEALRIYNGEMYMYPEHFARLERCAREIHLQLPFSKKDLKENLDKLIALEEIIDGEVYFQVSRGLAAPRNHRIPTFAEAKPVITANAIPYERPIAKQKGGETACLVEDKRWLHCNIKSLSLLGNILSLDEARRKGYEDALLVRNGYFTEASASNLWFVINGVLYTHPDGNLVLPGITKLRLLEIAHAEGLSVKEEAVPVTNIDQIEECFVSNSLWEVVPITSIDGKPVNNGSLGKVTAHLQQKYIEWISK